MLPHAHHSVCGDTYQFNGKVQHCLLRTLHCTTGVQQHSSVRQTHSGNSNISAQLNTTLAVQVTDKTDK